MAAPSLEGHGAPQLEETENLNVEFVDEDLPHQFNENPLELTSLDVEFPSSRVATTIVILDFLSMNPYPHKTRLRSLANLASLL